MTSWKWNHLKMYFHSYAIQAIWKRKNTYLKDLRSPWLWTTWMSQEVSKWLENGLFHLLINGIYWGYNPLILTTIDPNFLGHPSTCKLECSFLTPTGSLPSSLGFLGLTIAILGLREESAWIMPDLLVISGSSTVMYTVYIPAPSNGCCLNPKGLLNGTLSHSFRTRWRVHV